MYRCAGLSCTSVGACEVLMWMPVTNVFACGVLEWLPVMYYALVCGSVSCLLCTELVFDFLFLFGGWGGVQTGADRRCESCVI